MSRTTIVHNGITIEPTGSYTTIQSDIVGHGTYEVGAGGALGFLYGVDAGQTIEVSNQHPNHVYGASALDILDPAEFHARIDLSYVTPPANSASWEQSQIAFPLIKFPVDSYSYNAKTDLLKLWRGDTVAKTISLTVHDPYGISVQEDAGWMFASTNTATIKGIDSVHGHSPVMVEHLP